ncbi:MAG: DUF3159 domain-containing protein [Acidimicrobiia bacterium]|nr:DUF3159 domain-containing protein [Acidimicrobiia bacterium]
MSEPDPHQLARPPSWGPSDSFNSLLPVLAFLGLNSLFGLGWAIAGTTATSLYAAWSRRSRGLDIGWFIPVIALVLIARATAGIITDSEDVYFGIGIGLKFATVAALVGSVVIRRNAVGFLAPYVIAFETSTVTHRIYRSTTSVLTLIWAVFLTVTAVFDIWLLANSSANGYVLIRFLVSWPLSTVTFATAIVWASRRLAQIPGFPGLLSLLEAQVEAQRPEPAG